MRQHLSKSSNHKETLKLTISNKCESSVSVEKTAHSVAESDQNGALLSATSNLSIQYNLGVIAPALLLLDSRGISSSAGGACYPRSDSADSLLKSLVFAGAILGQCSMGCLGDIVGLDYAMLVTNLIAFIGTVVCAIAPMLVRSKDGDSLYLVLAIARAILGFGVGGKYPLASAITAETAECSNDDRKQDHHHRAREVARSFFWQTPGAIFPYVASLILLLLFGEDQNGRDHLLATNLQFGILVGLGAIPSAIVLFLTWGKLRNKQAKRCSSVGQSANLESISPQGHLLENPLRIVLRNKILLHKLIGTGVTWALYDFCYYGTSFNQPELLATVFATGNNDANHDSLIMNSWQNVIVSTMGIPGVVCAVKMMGPVGPKPLLAWGFVAIASVSVFFAVCFLYDDFLGKASAFLAFSFLIFSLNWGCNVSTYVLPMEVFPKEVRSSLHGLSAGMGKLGAFFGSYAFSQLNKVSVSLTFAICAASCFVGILVTWIFVEPFGEETFLSSNKVKDSISMTCTGAVSENSALISEGITANHIDHGPVNLIRNNETHTLK